MDNSKSVLDWEDEGGLVVTSRDEGSKCPCCGGLGAHGKVPTVEDLENERRCNTCEGSGKVVTCPSCSGLGHMSMREAGLIASANTRIEALERDEAERPWRYS
ncbi:hypothetical protein LCGC14_0311060 [marine sediment metagenome]|uniref:CR-type domain-containing protein n=1 Tax=marine sediment metagenome TaxID=412755 RepID=A0A0F9WTY4_9ZZZZ